MKRPVSDLRLDTTSPASPFKYDDYTPHTEDPTRLSCETPTSLINLETSEDPFDKVVALHRLFEHPNLTVRHQAIVLAKKHLPDISPLLHNAPCVNGSSLPETLKALLKSSARFNFSEFKAKFPNPSAIRSNGMMERFLINFFVNTLLPACAGYPEVDGIGWGKPEIKATLRKLWHTLTEGQQDLIFEALDNTPFLEITPGTLAQIDYPLHLASSTPEKAECPK